MSELEQEFAAAWLKAAKELSVEVQSPCALCLSNDVKIRVLVYVPHFWGPKGTVAIPADEPDMEYDKKLSRLLEREGFYVSILNAVLVANYDAKRFRDTLNDWHWFGPDHKRPYWYTGVPWGGNEG